MSPKKIILVVANPSIYTTLGLFDPHAVREGNLITGQQQNSGYKTAKLVLEALELTV